MVHCSSSTCKGPNKVITSPDTESLVGHYTSLALDGAGNPVVSYNELQINNSVLKVLHCNDPNCARGDESITSPDTGGGSSLELDVFGNPVVSYVDVTNFDLKLLYCDDPNCR